LKKLVISIVTWNSESVIVPCIQSILDQSYKDFELWIVDNNSYDNTCKRIVEISDPSIKLYKLESNIGFCGGHNYSINNSHSEYVLLVNPDILMSNDYIENALKVFDDDSKIGTVCGLLIRDGNRENGTIDSAGMNFTKDCRFVLRYHGKPINRRQLFRTEVPGADGALPLYRREMIDDIKVKGQFFDEMFFAHKEDWDVSWRSRLYGWKIVFEPACTAWHPRSFRQGSPFTREKVLSATKYHAVKNQLIMMIKNQTFSVFLKHFIFIITRQIGIVFYCLLFERSSLKAYLFVATHLKEIIQTRDIIISKYYYLHLHNNN